MYCERKPCFKRCNLLLFSIILWSEIIAEKIWKIALKQFIYISKRKSYIRASSNKMLSAKQLRPSINIYETLLQFNKLQTNYKAIFVFDFSFCSLSPFISNDINNSVVSLFHMNQSIVVSERRWKSYLVPKVFYFLSLEVQKQRTRL